MAKVKRRFSTDLQRVAENIFDGLVLQVPLAKVQELASEEPSDPESDYYMALARSSWKAAIAFIAAGQDTRDSFNAALDQEPEDTSAMTIDDAVDHVARKPEGIVYGPKADADEPEVAGMTVQVVGIDPGRVKASVNGRPVQVEGVRKPPKPPCQCATCQLRRQLEGKMYTSKRQDPS